MHLGTWTSAAGWCGRPTIRSCRPSPDPIAESLAGIAMLAVSMLKALPLLTTGQSFCTSHSGSPQPLMSRGRGAHPVVARQPVDARLHQDEAELAVLVLAEQLQVLPHAHRLLDQVVQVLRNLRRQAQTLEQPENGRPVDRLHLQGATNTTRLIVLLARRIAMDSMCLQTCHDLCKLRPSEHANVTAL